MTEQSNNQEHNATDTTSVTSLDSDSQDSSNRQNTAVPQTMERLSVRKELIAIADEEIEAASDEQEKLALRYTKEDVLLAMDAAKGKLEA